MGELPDQDISPWAQSELKREKASRFRWHRRPWKASGAHPAEWLVVVAFIFGPAAFALWWMLAMLWETIFGSPTNFL